MSKKPTKKVAAPPRQSSALVPGTARDVEPLIERVVTILEEARAQVVRTVNSVMVLAYWHIGREIVELVQRGAKRAGYGEQVLDALSARLRERVGRGYSTTNLRYFRTFYLAFRDRAPEIRHIEGGESGRQAQVPAPTFATSEVAFLLRRRGCRASTASRPCSGGPTTDYS